MKKPNRGAETWRRMNNSIRRGSEERSKQKVIGTYFDDKIGRMVTRYAGPPESTGFHQVHPDWCL